MNSPRDMQLFREVRNQYTQSVRKAKASFFKQKFASYSSNSKSSGTLKSMENKSTSSQLPTALRLGNTVTTDKSMIIKLQQAFLNGWPCLPPGYSNLGQQLQKTLVKPNACFSTVRCLHPQARLASDGSDLEYVDIYKYLGVWLDYRFSFQTHIKHLQSKIKSRVGFLFRNKASFTPPNLP